MLNDQRNTYFDIVGIGLLISLFNQKSMHFIIFGSIIVALVVKFIDMVLEARENAEYERTQKIRDKANAEVEAERSRAKLLAEEIVKAKKNQGDDNGTQL